MVNTSARLMAATPFEHETRIDIRLANNGSNKIADFDQWMKLDLQYIDNWSLSLDFKIFLKTIPVVLLGKGAS